MRKTVTVLAALFLLAGCGAQNGRAEETVPETVTEEPVQETVTADEEIQEEETEMILKINGEIMNVTWEENESVNALKQLAENGLQIETHMYGGWEQVGPIGQRLPSNDVNTTAQPGDIMLYSSNQIVIFYGNNSWAYTKLGHINSSREELETILSADTVQVEITAE
ncbi:MAG: cyclophilin-like fold protein [Erysipelotrichaceae bacterium]|nr:cyclophilin-like fold protein [Erysipelotrichaceae bacterium]